MSATQLFKIDPRNLPASKSKDRLKVWYNPTRSRIETALRGYEVSMYDVLNQTERTAHEVEFTNLNGRKLGGCTCESRIVCKHITRTVPLHIYRKQCERTAAARVTEQHDSALWRTATAR